MPSYRNISFAAAQTFSDLLSAGNRVSSRNGPTRELPARVTELTRPQERYVFLPHRDVSPILQFAETMWVLAGRNDVEWLSRYSTQAPHYSDDGMTWRAGYGPRLRVWPPGVDQLAEVRRLLSRDPLSRRAVIALFDPARDFIESRDIPCNNWLCFMLRDNALRLSVAVRSNDAMWGFSGINAFEWSALQEMLAHWLGTTVGPATYLASSFHLYENHVADAEQIVSRFHGVTAYDYVGRAAFATPWALFEERLGAWFSAEEMIRRNPDDRRSVGDPFFDSGLDLVRLKWGALSGWAEDRLRRELELLPDKDHTAAAYLHFSRKRPALRDDVPQPGIARFFEGSREGGGLPDRFRTAIKRLHAAKDRAYGAAWKRRGERLSIVPNVARKVDRLEEYAKSATSLSDESALDTAVDLYVYLVKYRLWLAERGAPGAFVAATAPTPFSDHEANFDEVVDRLPLEGAADMSAVIATIGRQFEVLWTAVENSGAPAERIPLVDALLRSAGSLVGAIFLQHPALVVRFVGQEIAS